MGWFDWLSANERMAKQAEKWKATGEFSAVVVRTYAFDYQQREDMARMRGMGYEIVAHSATAFVRGSRLRTRLTVTYQLRPPTEESEALSITVN
jgi:hypothetical protein